MLRTVVARATVAKAALLALRAAVSAFAAAFALVEFLFELEDLAAASNLERLVAVTFWAAVAFLSAFSFFAKSFRAELKADLAFFCSALKTFLALGIPKVAALTFAVGATTVAPNKENTMPAEMTKRINRFCFLICVLVAKGGRH